MTLDVTITGVAEIQAALGGALAALKPTGALGMAVKAATTLAAQYAAQIDPRDTGTQRASERGNVDGLRGHIFRDPSARNPKGGALAAIYGAANEMQRGGRYAVYARTVTQGGPDILKQAGAAFVEALP